jgi:AraC-like DNA-binding protein
MSDHSFPGTYVLYSIELVKRWGITADELLAGLEIDVASLGDVRTRLPLLTILTILGRARTMTREPAFGYYLGLQMRVSAHGLLGMVILNAATLREAIDLATRFLAPVITTAFGLRLEIEGSQASLILVENADFGEERECIVLATLIAIWQVGLAITGREMNGCADLALPEPLNRPQLLVGAGRLRFNQPVHRLTFEANVLDARPTMADPVALRLALEQCERVLASRGPNARLTERVRSLVILGRGRPAPLERIAQALRSSPRTLKRQLAAEGTTFSAIVEEERREQAFLRLPSAGTSVKDVAVQLGYANAENFARAFHRWTGSTPSEYQSAGASNGRGRAGGERSSGRRLER